MNPRSCERTDTFYLRRLWLWVITINEMEHGITRIVQFEITVLRGSYANSGYGPSYWEEDSREVTHQLRAEVTDFGPDHDPLIIWLDLAHVQDLDLSAEELSGAEERAIEEYHRVSGLVKAQPMLGQIVAVSA